MGVVDVEPRTVGEDDVGQGGVLNVGGRARVSNPAPHLEAARVPQGGLVRVVPAGSPRAHPVRARVGVDDVPRLDRIGSARGAPVTPRGQPGLDPVGARRRRHASAHGVRSGRAGWDYADEAPLRDARAFEMGRGVADPSSSPTSRPRLANIVLTNGARRYVDHAHPEYSSPEVTTPAGGRDL